MANPAFDDGDEEEKASGGGWLVSYADLMTLLFAAFVVLYGIKPEGESQQVLGVRSSIREAFVEIPDHIPDLERKGPLKNGKSVFSYFKGEEALPPIAKKYRRSTHTLNVINDDLSEVRQLVTEMSQSALKGEGKPNTSSKVQPVTFRRSEEGFSLRLASVFFFDKGSDRLQPALRDKLIKMSKLLAALDKRIVIEGHTDTKPESDSITNWELSTRRATYVLKLMNQDGGVPATMLSASGYADTRPLVSEGSGDGETVNGRIEIKVQYEHVPGDE